MLRLLLFGWIGVLLFDCKGQEASTAAEKNINKGALYTTWYYHSVNNKSESVFVADNSNLPPARFREKLTFEKSSNRVGKTVPGPTDRAKTKYGEWKWIDSGRLVLQFEGEPNDTLSVQSLDDNQLIFNH